MIDRLNYKQTIFDKQFTKLLNSIKSLENQKRLPPKFSNLLQPLQFVIQNKANQMTSNEQVTNAKPKYIPPSWSKMFNIPLNLQSVIAILKDKFNIQIRHKKKNFSPNKINRVCKYLDQKKTRPMNYNIGEFYADFQNDSQIVGKNKLLDYKLQSSELNKIAKTSLSVDTSQLQEISRFSNFHEQY